MKHQKEKKRVKNREAYQAFSTFMRPPSSSTAFKFSVISTVLRMVQALFLVSGLFCSMSHFSLLFYADGFNITAIIFVLAAVETLANRHRR